MKKILIIIGICLLLLIGGYVFVMKTSEMISYGDIIGVILLSSTGVPTYVGNTILPPPDMTKKSNEEKKEMLIKLLRDVGQSEDNYQIMKSLELKIKIVRIGTPIIPVLIELFKDESMDKREKKQVEYAGEVLKNMRILRDRAKEMLKEIIEAKIVPLEEKLLQKCPPSARDPLMVLTRHYIKRFYKNAKRIEIDMDRMTAEMIGLLLVDEDSQTKTYASEILGAIGDRKGIDPIIKVVTEERLGTIGTVYKGGVELLKKTGDKRLAKALDQNGADYGLWIWADRDKAIKIAIDVLRDNYNPGLTFRQKEHIENWVQYAKNVEKEREKETESQIKKYAITVLGNAKAKEASRILLEMLKEEEKTKYEYYHYLIEALQKMGEEDTITKAIEHYVEVLKKEPSNTYVIGLIGSLARDGGKANSAVPILLELLKREKDLNNKRTIKTLISIIDTLGWIKDKRAVEPLKELNIESHLKKLIGDTFRQKETNVYILYQDSKGKMAKAGYDPVLIDGRAGHVGLYIVPAEGEPYLIDVVKNIGVRIVKTAPLLTFKSDGKQIWAFKLCLEIDKIDDLVAWAKKRENLPYQAKRKGADAYDCVGFVESGLESVKLDLVPRKDEFFLLLPYEQMVRARKMREKIREIDITELVKELFPPRNDHPERVLDNPLFKETGGPRDNVALLYHGFPEEASSIINYSCWLWPDVELEEMKQYPVLIIPSGGFFSQNTSEILKDKLAKYVEDGGVIVCFAQQQGYEFSYLPGTLSAYGWTEDQSSWTNAAYIETYRPCFAGQTRTNLDVNVDGYFADWPSSSTILLKRTKNHMPCLLIYPYGEGYVIASTLFSDWGYGHNQISKEEIALMRDLISWAKDLNKEILEFKPQQEVGLDVEVTNNTDKYSDKVILTLIDPEQNIIGSYTLQISIPPCQTKKINFTSFLIPHSSSLGIWWIDYELEDNVGNIIQPQTEGGRFSISHHFSSTKPIPEITYSVTTLSEELMAGGEGAFTIHLWNHGQTSRKIRIKWKLNHGRSEDDSGELGSFSVKPGKKLTIAHKVKNIYETRGGWWELWVFFYDEQNHLLGQASSAGRVLQPLVELDVKKIYLLRKNGILMLNIRNKEEGKLTTQINIKITDPSNETIFLITSTLYLSSRETRALSYHFNLSREAREGLYIIQVEAMSEEKRIGFISSNFEIPPKSSDKDRIIYKKI